MGWNIEVFEDGTARFFEDVMGTLYGVFLGALPFNCTVFELRVQGCLLVKTGPSILCFFLQDIC